MLWNNVPCVKHYTNKTDLTNILNLFISNTNLLWITSDYLEYVQIYLSCKDDWSMFWKKVQFQFF